MIILEFILIEDIDLNNMKILTYDPRKKKTVLCGTLEEDTFVRVVEPRHFMKVMQGYGIQEDAFQEILSKGCKRIIIKTKTHEYYAPVSIWLEHSKIADYSAGKQRFVSLKFMKLRKFKYEPIVNTNTVRKIEYFEDINTG